MLFNELTAAIKICGKAYDVTAATVPELTELVVYVDPAAFVVVIATTIGTTTPPPPEVEAGTCKSLIMLSRAAIWLV